MTKSGNYTISQLAHFAGVPTTTVRYYERDGLLRPEDRSAGNYRLYSDDSVHRLRFIRAAQGIGFTLDDVKLLLGGQGRRTPPCGEVQGLLEQRLSDITQRLKDLRHVQRVLKNALEKCRKTEQDNCCHVVESLKQQR